MDEETDRTNRLGSLITTFRALQSERVEAYRLFEEGFVAYLNGAPNYNLEMYKQLVAQITTTFQKISKDIIDIITDFQRSPHNSISTILSKIQSEEQKKLKLVADLQMCRQRAIDDEIDLSERISDLKEQLKEIEITVSEELENLKYESEDLYKQLL